MTTLLTSLSLQLQQDLQALKEAEELIDAQIKENFHALTGSNVNSNANANGNSTNSNANSGFNKKYFVSPIATSVKKLEEFAPCFEAIDHDTTRLMTQIEECHNLSDKMSKIVRHLDTLQVRAQAALTCTEDIIKLRECRINLAQAVEKKDLLLGVKYVRQIHDIDADAVAASEDLSTIQQLERELTSMVKTEFLQAIDTSNIDLVMSLCPLLQTLGLEIEARDNFMEFLEKKVFIVVSADLEHSNNNNNNNDSNMDESIQSLSVIFNSTYTIFQQYLPLVIQGLDGSHGDIHFIRKLHARCEKESAVVLKRFVKQKNLKQILKSLSEANGKGGYSSSSSLLSQQQQSQQQQQLKSSSSVPSDAEMHVLLDEIALIVQYCCVYARYLNQLCEGAEKKIRKPVANTLITTTTTTTTTTDIAASGVVVFSGQTEFTQIIDELINRYYLVCEMHLMKESIKTAKMKMKEFEETMSTTTTTTTTITNNIPELDECFFVLKRCGQRALMTKNIQAACAVLRVVTDLLSTELLVVVVDSLKSSFNKLLQLLQDHLNKLCRSTIHNGDHNNNNNNSASFNSSSSDFYQNLGTVASAISIASAITINSFPLKKDQQQQQQKGLLTGNDVSVDFNNNNNNKQTDIWGTAKLFQVFDLLEVCVRYCDQLTKEITSTGETVFGSLTTTTTTTQKATSEIEKLRLCQEDFESVKSMFSQTLRKNLDRVIEAGAVAIKELFLAFLSNNNNNNHHGIKFDLPDDVFENQQAAQLLPMSLINPLEVVVDVCTCHLNESSKDVVVERFADIVCTLLEQIVSQTNFYFAGALKFEEACRAVISLLNNHSNKSIRAKFARIRDILSILTFDFNSSAHLMMDSYNNLTNSEILMFMSLRLDSK